MGLVSLIIEFTNSFNNNNRINMHYIPLQSK